MVIPSLRATVRASQDSTKSREHGAISSPEVQAASLFARQNNRRAEFSMGALEFGHGLSVGSEYRHDG